MPRSDLFFVLGAPKSGTTWLERALDEHPEVHCKGEGKFPFFRERLVEATQAYNRFVTERNRQVFGRETFPKVDIAELDDVFRTFVEGRLRRGGPWPGVKRLGTKDPDLGLYIAEIAPVFPEADYIHIIRDPRDACVSMWHHMRRVHPERAGGDFEAFLIDTAKGWTSYIAGVRTEVARRKLSYLEVRYEDMAQDMASALRDIFAMLDVATTPERVARCVEATRFPVLAGGREAGEEDRSSFFRKGKAGGWRDDLSDVQAAAIMAVAGETARGLGYR